MAGIASFFKTILIPLLLASLLYLALSLLLLPFIRRHRSRYAQYLPLTDFAPPSWRTKVSDALYNLFVPATWGRNRRVGVEQHEDELFDDEEGEGMVGFDVGRREALERRRSMGGVEGDGQRVGRELEEGFKDESSDEEEVGDERGR